MSGVSKFQKFFADYFQESWLDYTQFEDYFKEVCSLPVEKLGREETKWEEEKEQLLQSQKNLAFKNYRSFVATAGCSKDILTKFEGVETSLDSVLTEIPELQQSLNTALNEARSISARRKENTISVSRHPQLLEILELPQLMDTSVRNAYYDEALELHAFVQTLVTKHPGIPILQCISDDVEECLSHMEHLLLAQLRAQLTLPACLKSIGLLRRMGRYNETQLKVRFLQLRTQWFKTVVAAISTEDIQYYMSKLIDSYRVHLFDIVTQYRAVFLDELDKGGSLIFNAWLNLQVSTFLHLLSTNLEKCNGSTIDSTLAQSMYFGMSLGRVGADFRGALVPIYERVVLKICSKSVQAATRRLERDLPSMKPGPTFSHPYTDTNSGPPVSLLSFPVMAVYLNQILTALNETRLCTPLPIQQCIVHTVQCSLESAVSSVVDYCSSSENTEYHTQLCTVLVLEMLPYLSTCLNSLFTQLPAVCLDRAQRQPAEFMSDVALKLNLPLLTSPLEPFLSTPTVQLMKDLHSNTASLGEDHGNNTTAEEEDLPLKDPSVQPEDNLSKDVSVQPEENLSKDVSEILDKDVTSDTLADNSALNESFATDTIPSVDNTEIMPVLDKMGDPISSENTSDIISPTDTVDQPEGGILDVEEIIPVLDKMGEEITDNVEAESSPTKEVLPALDKMGDPIVEDNLNISSDQGEVLPDSVEVEDIEVHGE